MVVDDNAVTRRMVKTALARNGHEVIEAPDGRTALELMRTEHPGVVIQDLILPDADGFDLVGQLRDAATGDVSILAFSGFVSQFDEARVSTVGFDDLIAKPIAPSRLVPLVEAHLPAEMPRAERFGVGKRLVVADDDPLQLKLATFRLGRVGFEVESVADGRAALEAIRRRRPDAVVSDVMMPELDGFGLAMALRQDQALRTLPLVLVTSSYVERSDRELARRAGANDLVVRTPDLVELIDNLRATLSAAAEPEALQPDAVPELERERNRRVMRQLERQVLLNTGLAKRCSSLASELTVLAGISEAVLKHRDVDAALDEALASCFDAGGASVGALYLVEPDGSLRARSLGEVGWTPGDLATFFGHEDVLRQVMMTGEPLQLPSPDVPRELAEHLIATSTGTGLLLVPLVGAGGPLGALFMVSHRREIDQDDWCAFAVGVGNQISQVLTLARAYSEREAAEQKAARHAALLEAVVESAPDIVIQLDLDGIVRFVNRTLAPLVPADAIGEHWLQRMSLDQREAARRALDTVVETGGSAGYDLQLMREGQSLWFQCRLGPVRQDGKLVGFVVIARDITSQKQTEMQLMLADRMASVGTLAAGVAHEINNPLAAVIANLDMAVHDVDELGKKIVLPHDLAEELRDARLSADRVREIVRDLKIFSRAQEDRRGACDVEKMLESTLRMAWNELRHRARVVKRYGKVPRVDANESRLGQVFLNLIVNAAQAIPEGRYDKNEIWISTAHEGDQIVVAIRDTGAGIPIDVRPRLFTPFFTTKPVGVGTGLGLAISHRIVTQLGGTITFESELGKGTEFRVTLPVAPEGLQPITARVITGKLPSRRGRVLVVDDEEALAHAIRRYLSQDHEVEAVTSARRALELLKGGARFDVILSDLMMPQISGIELHAEIAKLDPAQAEKMVFLTGGAFTATARAFLDATPNRRLEKPFELKALRHLVNELVT